MARKKHVKGNAKAKEKFMQIFAEVRWQHRHDTEAQCEHFVECGGCDLQEHSYGQQVAIKKQALERLIKETPGMSSLAKLEVEAISSPRDYKYRQRMDFIVTPEGSGQRRGDGKKGIVALTECLLVEDENYAMYQKTLELSRDLSLEAYNQNDYSGCLRYIIIRRTRSGEQLISLLTTSTASEEVVAKIAEKLLAEGVDSVYWNVNDSRLDDSLGECRKFWGKEFINETLLGRDFILGPLTFFQANHEVASAAYSSVRDFIKESKAKNIHDLYSGTCTMPVIFSDLVDTITAVENFSENVRMAEMNLEANKITNVNFIEQDVAEFLQQEDLEMEFSVLNPPRKGMHEQALRRILELAPDNLAYLSCSPRSLLEDLGILFREYKPVKLQLFDMFPQTEHFETLVLLTKKDR
ncbi:23S rRNA (uracil(1939)-C(5))-methyltransferase RlmD [Lentisphaera profundi]|uniref:23S rRNA (Uracil(1939)-C(5))-methyltransferase RlmD n=1 Tax=Lentisphaera profundi TaxID=1658616 RepID=A0ABY7W056_9BACT|nr:23S rRNA (uracil(1939)-C(5))-methyltransferase RlmD [Lentisphaera profundi]WDE98364.1 23S rRNA (uracil(1939)-C(5))-methyltransferase RlmD [Lentisphaera profundi]